MEQKRFIDIKHAILEPTEWLQVNLQGFVEGDRVVIQSKIDGANSCVAYDKENFRLTCFSSKNELNEMNTLRGFWNYVRELEVEPFKAHPSWRVYGEWLVPHAIAYDEESYNKWYVYDIFDVEKKEWLLQDEVRAFCGANGLIYVHTYYDGPFLGWDHVRSFMDSPVYGFQLEGVIIKNQDKINDRNSKFPDYLKIVHPKFDEIRREGKKNRTPDPVKEAAREKAQEAVDVIVTKARVEKMLRKLVDEGILPEVMAPEDMKKASIHLPKRIYEDCVKEHDDIVRQGGEYFGKMSSSQTMRFAKEIILGRLEA